MHRQKDKKRWIATLKPVEMILKGVEQYTWIKGIPDSFVWEMDKEVHLSEKKGFENVLFMVHRGYDRHCPYCQQDDGTK